MSIPWPLEPVQVDKMTVKLYPVINSTMKPPKRAHAFQVNKTVLMAPGIDRYLMLDVLGAQLNLSAIVDGIRGQGHNHCCRFSRPFASHQQADQFLSQAKYPVRSGPNESQFCQSCHLGQPRGDCVMR
jgi:hypothetical protein